VEVLGKWLPEPQRSLRAADQVHSHPTFSVPLHVQLKCSQDIIIAKALAREDPII
jgi:hypothetical protein